MSEDNNRNIKNINKGQKRTENRKLHQYIIAAIGVLLILAILLFVKMGRPDKRAVDTRTIVPVDSEVADIEEIDPIAYTSRNWADYMEMPLEEQIASAEGDIRSPYIAFYINFPGVDQASEYCVDMHVDHQPKATYCCPIDWWTDVSSLEQQYVSVYNDYTGTPGGYCGFQTLDDGSRVFIMTVWNIFCKDKEGNEIVYVPEVIILKETGKSSKTMRKAVLLSVSCLMTGNPGEITEYCCNRVIQKIQVPQSSRPGYAIWERTVGRRWYLLIQA